ncbi:pitrilysin family protein [Halocella sp. SP3-1]|uniref:M16 family metallopeptidase n=1 Tax=Halocella sp. SP3-1 TaxID=2382161 RepID=UPI0025704100|nr:pitrilysin family protein [Halocella sp. SP3-1]
MRKRRMINVFIVTVLLLITIRGLSLAAEINGEIADLEFDYTYSKLDNGLEIYVFEDHTVPLVNFSLWYKVGSFHEKEGITGISHLLEHIMFLGTNTLEKDQIHKLVKTAGGSNNAGTNYEYTVYYEEDLPSSKLELAMAIEADRMRNLKIDKAEFLREKEVVKQERRMRVENDFFQSSMEEIMAIAFKKSPLHHQIVGWMEDIDNITVEQLRDYYKMYYTPNNAIMAVSGDVDPQEVLLMAEKYYGNYQAKEIDKPKLITEEQQEERVIKLSRPTRVPYIVMLYKIPEGNHQDMVAINVLLDILVNNSTSRVTKELEQRKQLILAAGARASSYSIPGFAQVILVPTSTDEIESVQKAFEDEVEKLINNGVSEEEIEIVKRKVLKTNVFASRDMTDLTNLIISDVIKFNNPEQYNKEIKLLNQLSSKDIVQVAEKYFVKNKRTVGYIIPDNQ